MKTICRLLALVVLLGVVAAPSPADAKPRKNNKNNSEKTGGKKR